MPGRTPSFRRLYTVLITTINTERKHPRRADGEAELLDNVYDVLYNLYKILRYVCVISEK